MPILAPSRFGLTKQPVGEAGGSTSQAPSRARPAGGTGRPSAAQHRAGAELVLAERKQRIVGADGRQPVEPGQRRRRAAAEIGDAVGQRPDERRLRDRVRRAARPRRRARRARNASPRCRAGLRRWRRIRARDRSTARDRRRSPARCLSAKPCSREAARGRPLPARRRGQRGSGCCHARQSESDHDARLETALDRQVDAGRSCRHAGRRARCSASMPFQAEVTAMRSASGPTKAGQEDCARRHGDGADALAVGRVGVERGRAPARVPQRRRRRRPPSRRGQPSLPRWSKKTAGSPIGRPVERVAVDAHQHVGRRIGEIGDRAVRRKADRVGDGDAGKQRAQLALEEPVDGAAPCGPRPCAMVPIQKAPQGWTRESLERVSRIVGLERRDAASARPLGGRACSRPVSVTSNCRSPSIDGEWRSPCRAGHGR